MRKYETIVVFDPNLGEAELKEEIQRVQGILTTRGAVEISVENWGKKEISYLVRRHRFGHFVCIKFDADSSTIIEETTGLLRITERVIKFQTHRLSTTTRKFKGNPKKVGSRDNGGDDFFVGDSDY